MEYGDKIAAAILAAAAFNSPTSKKRISELTDHYQRFLQIVSAPPEPPTVELNVPRG